MPTKSVLSTFLVAKDGKKDLQWSVAVISLFSSNAMEEFILLLQKLNAGLLRPWRQGQLTGSTQALLVFSLAKPLLSVVMTMLSHLFKASGEVRIAPGVLRRGKIVF